MIERDVIVPGASRRTLGQAGDSYVDHLEHVMQRKRSTIQDYRGHLRRQLVPFFGKRPIDKIAPPLVAQYLKRKRDDGLSSKTVQNHVGLQEADAPIRRTVLGGPVDVGHGIALRPASLDRE